MRYESGMLAKSLAGHDQNRLYVILREDADCVYLADGRSRTIERPKKKKKKHVQLISKIPEAFGKKKACKAAIGNEEIKKVIGGSAHV